MRNEEMLGRRWRRRKEWRRVREGVRGRGKLFFHLDLSFFIFPQLRSYQNP